MKAVLIAAVILAAFALPALASEHTMIDAPGYSITPADIKIKSFIGAFKIAEVKIVNKERAAKEVAVAIEGAVTDVLKLANTTRRIPGFANTTLALTFLTEKPGEFNGTLKILGGIIEEIPLSIKVADSNTPTAEILSVGVEQLENTIILGKPYRAIVHLQNLLAGKPLNVTIRYSLRKADNTTSEADLGAERIELNTSISLLKAFTIQGLTEGEYAFEAEASYLDSTISAKSRFKAEIPLVEKKLFGLVPVKHAFLAVVAGALLAGGYLYYKRMQKKKRRYVSKLYWDQLAKPGPRAITLGLIAETAKKAYFDLDQLQTHTLVAGSTGGGKTVSAQVFVEEALAKGVSVIVFDPTAQWTGFLRKNAEKKMLALYPRFGLKPADARGFNGNVRQIADPRQIIDIKKFMRPGEMTVFVVNRLEPQDIDIIVANTVRQVFRAHLPESKELKLLVIFDEVHRLLPKFGGSGQGFLQIERAAREFRKWGVGLFLISQVLTDFAGEIKANISSEVQMRTRDQGDLDRIKTKYGDYMLQSLLKSATGTGMVENASYNRGEPYFVSFRPLLHNHAALADEEMASYSKYNGLIDDAEYQLEQLKEEGVDIFDIELELKLAKDKLKTGNFNMVDIYLEGLGPRLEDEWKRLGKKPKKFQMQLLSDEELRQEHEEALKAKKKLEEQAGGKTVEKKEEEKPEFKPLRLKNGLVVLNPRELEDSMANMSAADFSYHVNDAKNDFADWAAAPDPALSARLRAAKTKEDVMNAFQPPAQQAKKK